MDERELLKLDNDIAFALYACSKGLIRKYNPVLERLGLTYTSYLAMLALWERDGQTIGELGKALFLDSGTLTPLLKKMEKQGFIVRERGDKDERVVHVLLTPKGKALRTKANELIPALKSTLQLLDENGLFKGLKDMLPLLYGI